MNRIFWLALLFATLLTGAALKGELPSLSGGPQPTTDAGCEADPLGRPCKPGS
jgi:hypothetical protein